MYVNMNIRWRDALPPAQSINRDVKEHLKMIVQRQQHHIPNDPAARPPPRARHARARLPRCEQRLGIARSERSEPSERKR